MATIKLKSLGLELGEIAVESYQDAQPQTIINQSPKSGYPVQAGEPVGLTVSGE
jgi:beta-lactam-binding protein with PASTA domain